jgi:hypothetical protein
VHPRGLDPWRDPATASNLSLDSLGEIHLLEDRELPVLFSFSAKWSCFILRENATIKDESIYLIVVF